MPNLEHLRRISPIGGEAAGKVSHAKGVANISKYNLNPKLCKTCNGIIEYNYRRNDFCSKSCAATHNNRGKRRHGNEPKKCMLCGKPIPRVKGEVCKKCNVTYRVKYGKPTHKTVRTYLLQTREYKCNCCGLEEWCGHKIPLELHYIDGNHDNNEETNLELVCPNCHVFTDTYKAKNRKDIKGKTRARIIVV